MKYPQLSIPAVTAEMDYSGNLEMQEKDYWVQDNAESYFANFQEMHEHLTEREKKARWADEIKISDTRLGFICDWTENIIKQGSTGIWALTDTQNRTRLVLISDKGILAIRQCALKSIEERAAISGMALSRVELDVYKMILNECLSVAPANGKVRIADGKISAFLSNDYVPVAMPDIFQTAQNYINQQFPANNFIEGYWSHEISSCRWEVTNAAHLCKMYAKALEEHGVSYTGTISPVINLWSSDIGTAGVNLMPMLYLGGKEFALPLGGPIGMHHKGKASLDEFYLNLQGVFALYSDRTMQLAGLLDIAINNPVPCIKNVMHKLQIPRKYRNAVISNFEIAYGTGTCTAHDVFIGLGEIFLVLQQEKASGMLFVKFEEIVAKALKFDYKHFDVKP